MHDDDELRDKNPHTLCLWQAPASTQKTKRKTRPAIRQICNHRTSSLPPLPAKRGKGTYERRGSSEKGHNLRTRNKNSSVKKAASQVLTAGFKPPGERPTQPSRPRPPPRPPVNHSMPGRGVKPENSGKMWRFCYITGRNRPVLSLRHRPSLLPSERPRSPNKGTRASC